MRMPLALTVSDRHGNLLKKIFYLNPAIGKFAGDARHQGRRCISIPQDLDNEADLVKLPIPQGEEMKKKIFHAIGESKKMNKLI